MSRKPQVPAAMCSKVAIASGRYDYIVILIIILPRLLLLAVHEGRFSFRSLACGLPPSTARPSPVLGAYDSPPRPHTLSLTWLTNAPISFTVQVVKTYLVE